MISLKTGLYFPCLYIYFDYVLIFISILFILVFLDDIFGGSRIDPSPSLLDELYTFYLCDNKVNADIMRRLLHFLIIG